VTFCIEKSRLLEQNILSGVVSVVAEEEVCFQVRSGVWPERRGTYNPWQGLQPDSWAMGSSRPATRTPLGAALFVRADLEIRMGVPHSFAEARRYQLHRNVYRSHSIRLWLGAGFTARTTLDRPVKLNCFVKARGGLDTGMGVSVARFRVRKPEVFEDLLSALSNTGS